MSCVQDLCKNISLPTCILDCRHHQKKLAVITHSFYAVTVGSWGALKIIAVIVQVPFARGDSIPVGTTVQKPFNSTSNCSEYPRLKVFYIQREAF